MDELARKKWNSIYSESNIGGQSVSIVLQDNGHLLPSQGRALDLACGTGSDSIFMAQQGLSVDAWDISDAVTEKISAYAKQKNLNIVGEARDINIQPPAPNTYDVVSVAHFLERDLMPILTQSLKPGGLIFYQTFTKIVTPTYSGPGNPAFRLDENELLDLFSDLTLVVYREEGLLGDIGKGFRNEAMIVAQKKE